MSKNKATWDFSLDAECPHCGEFVNLCDADDFWDGRHFTIPEHNTDRTRDVEVECPSCLAEFTVDLEY